MPLILKHKDVDITVGVWQVNENLYLLTELLDEPDVAAQAVAKFKSESRRVEWIAVRLLLKTLMGRLPKVEYLPSGRPYIADGCAAVSFSHTKGFVAVAVANPGDVVGVDIEYISERVHRVASRIVAPGERAKDTLSLLLHWCAKETIYKMIDLPEVDFVEHLYVHPFEAAKEAGTFYADEKRTGRHLQFEVKYRITRDFVLSYSLLNNKE